MPRKHIDVIGNKFGHLTALEYVGRDKYSHLQVRCICDCGREIIRSQDKLLNKGKNKNCGDICHRIKHGGWYKKEKLYGVWTGIKSRCYCPTDSGYRNYGARGIKVCDEWKENYEPFREWSLNNGYYEGCNLEIDRIDVNGNYSPENCRYISRKENCRNTRLTHFLDFNGEKKCVQEVSEITGLSPSAVKNRYKDYQID